MARIASSTNSSSAKPKPIFVAVGIMVLIIGILAGIYLVRSRITSENQAAEEFTHQITCSVGEIPEGRVCTVSVDGSPDSPQTVNPQGISHPDYLFKVKMETEGQEFLCKLDCGIEACMASDAASCGGLPEPSNSPTPSPTLPPIDDEPGVCGDSCGTGIRQCKQDLFCNQDGKCDHETECPKPSVTVTPTVTVSPSPTATPSPTGPTPTLPPGVTPSPTVTPRPTATAAPTPTTEVVCVPPNPAPNVALSCTSGTCSWGSVSGSDKYKVTVVDMTTDKKIAGFDPYKDVTGTSINFDTVSGHSYRCTVEAVNSCGAKQASSAYRDSEVCSTSQSSVTPEPSDIIVVNNTPTPKTPTPTLPPGTTPSSTPVPTLPVAGQINFSLWALVGISAIVFGLIAFR